jgi:ABC-type sugar transport system ATPase subunit
MSAALLQVKNLGKSFGGVKAVDGISFDLAPGELLALIGPNGAGKSTTFKLVSGVLGLTSGTVKFRGETISGLPSRAIARRGMSRTFQHVKMIPEMTVLENVTLGAQLRGNKNALSSMLRLDRAEEQSLLREAARQRGDDPNELPHRYATFINKVVAQKPEGMLLAMHLCRGNFKSTHAASGNYEPVAEALLKEMNLDAYFMEYDDDRSGDFKPLRFLPKGKVVVLGLVTTKFGRLENADDLVRRIDDASRLVPLEDLGLSPQCGFASTVDGNIITHDDQWRKLERVVEVARRVWGDVKA